VIDKKSIFIDPLQPAHYLLHPHPTLRVGLCHYCFDGILHLALTKE